MPRFETSSVRWVCDECSAEEEYAPDNPLAALTWWPPPGWLSLARSGEQSRYFCGLDCATAHIADLQTAGAKL